MLGVNKTKGKRKEGKEENKEIIIERIIKIGRKEKGNICIYI